MGEALAVGLLDGGWEAEELAVAEVDADRHHHLEAQLPGVRVVRNPAWAAGDAEVLVLACERARRVDFRQDRDAARIQRRVDEQRRARRLADAREERMQDRVASGIDRLNASRIVVVANAGRQSARFRLRIGGVQHVAGLAAPLEPRVDGLGRHEWSELFDSVGPERVEAAMRESLAWADQAPADNRFARLHAIRARHYLEDGVWISKTEAREEAAG